MVSDKEVHRFQAEIIYLANELFFYRFSSKTNSESSSPTQRHTNHSTFSWPSAFLFTPQNFHFPFQSWILLLLRRRLQQHQPDVAAPHLQLGVREKLSWRNWRRWRQLCSNRLCGIHQHQFTLRRTRTQTADQWWKKTNKVEVQEPKF